MSDTKLEKLRQRVAEDLRRSELTETECWIEDNEKYYTSYPNEIIRSHVLLKAMRAVAKDLVAPSKPESN